MTLVPLHASRYAVGRAAARKHALSRVVWGTVLLALLTLAPILLLALRDWCSFEGFR